LKDLSVWGGFARVVIAGDLETRKKKRQGGYFHPAMEIIGKVELLMSDVIRFYQTPVKQVQATWDGLENDKHAGEPVS
jgi:hypothetical protein